VHHPTGRNCRRIQFKTPASSHLEIRSTERRMESGKTFQSMGPFLLPIHHCYRYGSRILQKTPEEITGNNPPPEWAMYWHVVRLQPGRCFRSQLGWRSIRLLQNLRSKTEALFELPNSPAD